MTDTLPLAHEGLPIAWSPWVPAWDGTLAGCGRRRLPNPCGSCGVDGPEGLLTAEGRHGVAQAVAHFCQSCGELRVYLVPVLAPGERGRLKLIAHQPAHAGSPRLGR